MATTYLTRTFGTPTDTKKYTMSVWVKRGELSVQQSIARGTNGTDDSHVFTFNSDDTLRWDEYGSSATIGVLKTNRLFRDTSAWYNVVLAWDTTQATAGDRMKMWINGVEETSFATDTNPSLNASSAFNKASQPINIGRTSYGGGTNYFNGVLSHFNFIDGTAYDATAFGEYDANGVWTINTSPSVTYGTNGFFILKDGNSVTDQSPNTNNLTVGGGTLTNTEDSPSNVFATFNSLISSKGQTFSKGNTEVSTTVANKTGGSSTIGMSSGKYYAEFKIAAYDVNRTIIGITSNPSELDRTNVDPGSLNYGSGIYFDGRIYVNTSVVTTVGATTLNDIIGIALNLDDNNILYYINGVVQNSGTPISITASSSTDTGNYFFSVGDRSTTAYGTVQANFGNGYFGTSAVSSAGTNASGNGIFEFDVPTGYTALSTKGLNL